MPGAEAPNRRDVERMLELYCGLEYFGLRASASSLVIDDSRVRKMAVSLRDDASAAETLDAIHTALIRRAVYSPPALREDLGTNPDGTRLHAVASRRDIAQVVHAKGRSGSAALAQTDRSPQLWKATVAAKLSRLRKDQQRALIAVAILRIELVDIRNRLQAARSAVERFRNGKRAARNMRRHAEDRRGELRSLEEMKSDQLKRLVRTSMYRDGADRLWFHCTETPEIRAYLFREA